MIEHSVPAPVLGMFQFLENRPIERLTNAEHAALAGMDDRLIAGYKFGVCASLHLRFADHLQAALTTEKSIFLIKCDHSYFCDRGFDQVP